MSALIEEPWFPAFLLKTGELTFELTTTEPVPLWGYTKTRLDAMELVDFIAHEEGEIPSELYSRIIYEV